MWLPQLFTHPPSPSLPPSCLLLPYSLSSFSTLSSSPSSTPLSVLLPAFTPPPPPPHFVSSIPLLLFQGLKDDPELRGVIPNSFAHIFSHISRSQEQQYLVRASYLEIYQEEIRDLLAKDQSKRFELKVRFGFMLLKLGRERHQLRVVGSGPVLRLLQVAVF